MALKPAMHGRDHCLSGSDPIPCLEHNIEWQEFRSITDWGTSYTILDFTSGGQGPYYQSSVPTFKVNASSNIEIFKEGTYIIAGWFTNYVTTASVDTVRKFEAKVISGEVPHSLMGGFTWSTGHFYDILDLLNKLAQDVAVYGSPSWLDFMSLADGSFDAGTAGPTEIPVRAYKEENKIGVSETSVQVRIALIRLGSTFSDV